MLINYPLQTPRGRHTDQHASRAQEMTAIAYSDWDEMYGRPVVAAFGGREMAGAKAPADFKLGGKCLGVATYCPTCCNYQIVGAGFHMVPP